VGECGWELGPKYINILSVFHRAVEAHFKNPKFFRFLKKLKFLKVRFLGFRFFDFQVRIFAFSCQTLYIYLTSLELLLFCNAVHELFFV